MKKSFIICILVLTLFLVMLTSCLNNNSQTSNESPSSKLTDSEKITNNLLAESGTNSANAESKEEGIGGGVITVHKYRIAFNSIPQPFIELVGEDTYREWAEDIDQSVYSENMAMLSFIQDFNISRENFDKANLKWAEIVKDGLDGRPCIFPKDYANQETDEIFNSDILYTFDENIIKEYYLGVDYPFLYDYEFDEAVEKGEYTPQTEDWIDIDQMEADIIAKYGSAD